MAIVQTDVPMTSALCEQTIAALVQRYPGFQSQQLTTTAFGRPVLSLVIGTGDRKVLYSAAHHANEWITTPVLLKFLEELAQAAEDRATIFGVPAQRILETATLYTVPMVNPDGVDLVTGAVKKGSLEYDTAQSLANNYPQIPFPEGWKANLLGVDLNLQYPAGWLQAREIKFSQGFTKPGPRDYVGRAPLCQRESLALARYTEAVDPALVIAFHTQGEVIYWQFQDYVVPGAQKLAEEFSRLSGYALEDTPYQSSFAGYKDWFILNWRRPGFTIESGIGASPLPLSQFQNIYTANLGILVAGATGLAE